MNQIINDNKLILNHIITLQNQINELTKKIDNNISINPINNQQLIFDVGKYIGQVVNGLAEGKGIEYWNNGDRYEGDFRNGKKEGKGIYYYKSGSRYEGDWRNDKQEGKGIYYFHNGDRAMGDFYNGNPIGKHVTLTRNGEVKINNY